MRVDIMIILDAIGGFLEAAVSAISVVTDTVKSFLTKLDSDMKEIGSSALTALVAPLAIAAAVMFPELAIPEMIIAVEIICVLISDVTKILIGDDGIEPDDLGMRVSMAEKAPESFDNYGQYVEYLKTITPDSERLEAMSPEERLPYAMIGASIREKQLSESLGVDTPIDTFTVAQKVDMNAQEVSGYLEAAANRGIDELPSLGDYFAEDKLDGKAQVDARECLIDGISKANPDLSETAVEEKLFDYTDSFQTDSIEE